MNIASDLHFAQRRLRSRVVNGIHCVAAIDLPTLISVCSVFLVTLIWSCFVPKRRAGALARRYVLA